MAFSFEPEEVARIWKAKELIESRAAEIGRIVFSINGKRQDVRSSRDETNIMEEVEFNEFTVTVTYNWWWGDSLEKTIVSFPQSYFKLADDVIEEAEMIIKQNREAEAERKLRLEEENRLLFEKATEQATFRYLAIGMEKTMSAALGRAA